MSESRFNILDLNEIKMKGNERQTEKKDINQETE